MLGAKATVVCPGIVEPSCAKTAPSTVGIVEWTKTVIEAIAHRIPKNFFSRSSLFFIAGESIFYI
jgi:hypothetical protein